MPLPFSFSTQRQSFDSEVAVGTAGVAVLERVIMQQAPGHVTTEPLMGTPGNTFIPPTQVEMAPAAERIGLALSFPPAPSPNQRPVVSHEPSRPPLLLADTLSLPPPLVQAPSAPLDAPVVPEWAAQIEQLRNDIFGLAMSVSALNDRLDRLDQRTPQTTAGLAALRTEIGTWLHNHLGSAVEHCMHHIMSRPAAMTPAAPSLAAAPPVPN